MRVKREKRYIFVLLIAVLLISSLVLAKEESQEGPSTGINEELSVQVPQLSEIIPRAAELTTQLAILERKVSGSLDVSDVNKMHTEIETNLKESAGQLTKLKDSKEYKYSKLVELKEVIKQEDQSLAKINQPLNQEINQLGIWKQQWQIDQENWKQWQPLILQDESLKQLESTFEKANETIDAALNLIGPQLDALFAVQVKASDLQVKIKTMTVELNELIASDRHSTLFDASPPMFTAQYISQFSSDLWISLQRGIDEISWPGNRFYAQQGWFILVQAFVALVLIVTFYRNRRTLQNSQRWQFIAARPIAAGLFLVYMTTMVLYEYEGAPPVWKLAMMTAAGLSFAWLSAGLVEASWKRQLVYGLTIVLLFTKLMDILNVPIPLFRLYTVIVSLVGLFCCLRWLNQTVRQKGSAFYRWLLRLSSLFFAVIMIAQFCGKKSLASYLFLSSIDSIVTVFVFLLFIYMIHGGVEWLFRTPLVQRATLYRDTEPITRRMKRFMNIVMGGLVIAAILTTWGVYDSLEEAIRGLLAIGFNLGSQRISVGMIIVAISILYGSFLISWIIQKLFMEVMLLRRQVDRGIRYSMERLIHYIILLIGFLFALSTLGFEVTKITILLSALGVGIGFGLQGVVNNFVSGLILLFERPVRVGDTIELAGKWAEIRRIGLRSTTVKTYDEADLIIPNADLTTNQVTNWTLTNRLVRLTIPVGVAYGSDVSLVMETLAACAKDREMLSASRPAQVLFLKFGESSLDFELRVWVTDADHRLEVKSALHQEIDRRFRENKIEIAFPQRDLHLRSMDESTIFRTSETKK